MIKKPVDELTKLGIDISVLYTKMEMAFSRYEQTKHKVEDAIAEQNEKIKTIEKKLNKSAEAICKLAMAQGWLPAKTCEQASDTVE